ncbi:MAG TPA: amidohydrolase family protein [Longimicrobiaceae bacterium]|nr:amidohydrolase family protein [Longimicrobiaceae bacterium]
MRTLLVRCILFAAVVLLTAPAAAQAPSSIAPAPDRRPDEGEGPYPRLIIRGATLIDGTGAPPVGPVDIVVEGNRIREFRSVGYPGVPIRDRNRPTGATREIDATGMYVLPGFVDVHAHIGGAAQGTPAEYVYKLWLAHGITTVRDPGSLNGVDWTLRERERSARNQIVAPRIFSYVTPGLSWDRGPVTTPELGREYVRWAARRGVDGFKLGLGQYYDPDVMEAMIQEAKKHGLGTTAHLAQTGVARMNVLDAARVGLGSIQHWYGLPEALFTDRRVQRYPADYNYNDEQHRFGEAGRLWSQAAPPGSPRWNQVIDELVRLGFVIDPTFNIYEASRDLMRARTAEWHERYTLPSLWAFYQPSREAHGSYWFDWTTQNEIDWRENYRLWMAFINDFKNRGGQVCAGSDSGFIFQLYGFGFIRELELLQEAGFHPLEAIRAATLCGAEELSRPRGRRPEFGTVRPGMLADLVIVDQNPVRNLKVLYGTGHFRLDDATNRPTRTGGVKYTVKDGIVYDARRLLADVEEMVTRAKGEEAKRTGTLLQPSHVLRLGEPQGH